jgi:NAD-dependent dihydropyrimidine dehydrogenase PreA subunit
MCSTHEIADGAGLLDVLEQTAGQLRAAAGLPLGGAVSDAQLTQAMQRLEAIGRIVTGHKLAVVAEIDRRHAYLGARARSTEDLLATTLHISHGEARAQAELATKLEALPETAAALRDGRVGVGQVTETAKKADELAAREGGAELDAALDAHAASYGQLVDRGRLGRELDRFTEQAGVGVLADRERRAYAKRGVWFTETPDGLPSIRANMSVLGAAHVRAVLDALGKPDGAGDPRNVAQRHHDALVTLAEKYLDAGELPDVAAQKPHVLLITTEDALHGTEGAEPSLLDGHGPVSVETARQVCCDADVTRVKVSHRGKVLDAKPLRRDPDPAQRAAVIARDKACVGCGAPVSRCQVHHIVWASNGGPTTVNNLTLVCWTCHTKIHHHDWHVGKDHTGRYRAGARNTEHGYDPNLDNNIENDALRHTG